MPDQNQLYGQTKEALRRLSDQSPVFHLSMASMELFHSNLLNWAINTFGYDFAVLLFSKKRLGSGMHPVTSKTEDKKIDLTVRSGKHTIYLENKLKSLPDEDQLSRYFSKVQKYDRGEGHEKHFVLLHPDLLGSRGKDSGSGEWVSITYSKVVRAIGKAITEGVITEEYHRSLLKDYASYVERLLKMMRSFMPLWDTTEDYLAYGKGSIHDLMAQHGLHDLYDKHRFGYLERMIDEHLEKSGMSRADYDTNTGFTRGTGIASLWIPPGTESTKRLVVQFQHRSLKLMVDAETEDVEGLAKRLERESWFSFDGVDHEGKIYPVRNPNGFREYGNRMKYREVELNPHSLADLLKLAEKLAKRALEYRAFLEP